jgi:hypothetical protein
VTYVNISPAPNTRATIEAQGFSCVREGWFLGSRRSAAAANRRASCRGPPLRVTCPNAALLEEHAALGCIVLVLESAGEHLPFVFAPRPLLHRAIPGIKLAYCRDLATASGLPDRLAAIF